MSKNKFLGQKIILIVFLCAFLTFFTANAIKIV